MRSLAISFASLVKNNNGFFVSEKQAKFLSSQLFDKEYYVFNKAFNNSSATIYRCDDKGVLTVTKRNTVKGVETYTTVFDRINPAIAQSILDVKDEKKIKNLQKDLKHTVESLEYYSTHMSEFPTRKDQNFYNHLCFHKMKKANDLISQIEEANIKVKANIDIINTFQFFENVPKRSLYSCTSKALQKVEQIYSSVLKNLPVNFASDQVFIARFHRIMDLKSKLNSELTA